MTMAEAPQQGGQLAVPDQGVEGLEDFGTDDMVMPTLRINHEKGVFVDGLSNKEYPSIEVILLGLIKQRVLWQAEVQDGSDTPLCRSYDFNVGHPDLARFPWREAGFDATDETLPCESCNLKEWNSHPSRETPWCSEQHTFALMMPVNDDGDLAPALLTVQRSAIKPSKTYLTSFARSKTPLYTVTTKIDLDHRRRGTVSFAVPKFVQGAATDQAEWPVFASNYRNIRNFVQTPRGSEEDGPTETPVTDPSVNQHPHAPAQQAPAQQAPAQQAPAQQAPAQQAPAPAPQPAPAAQQPAPVPAAQPQPTPAAQDDGELPF